MYKWHNFPWNQYPWTNFNELNLDWIMRLLKEIQVEAIPALDEKIDNVYEYIRENLPEIIASITSAVIDVKAAGAVGDGTTDDSDAIRNALAMGDILYFPEGNYRFRDIEVNKPVYIIGNHATLTPIHKHPNTNQSYNMFHFYDHTFIQGIIFDHDNSVTTQSGTQYQTESAVIADNVECLIFEDCHIKNFFETYRLTVSGVAFEDRYGMFLKARDCEYVSFNNCEFNDFGGQELIQIAQGRARYSYGFVSITSCRFIDRNSGDTGSVFNVTGGTLNFSNNFGRNYNNVYSDGVTGGTIFNFMVAWANVSDNVFTDCVCGNYLDLSEGYYNKVESAVFTNNIFSGNCSNGIRGMCRQLAFRGNTIEGEKMVHTFTCNSIPSTGIPYHVDDSTLYEFDFVDISDNTFRCLNNPFGNAPTGITIPVFIGQAPAGEGVNDRAKYNSVSICNNHFIRSSDAVSRDSVYLYSGTENLTFNNNVVQGTGKCYPVFTDHEDRRAVLSSALPIDKMYVAYNVIDMDEYTDGEITYVCYGASVARPDTYAWMYFNIGFGSQITSDYSYAHMTESNNINIT